MVKVAVAQMNCKLGDVHNNVRELERLTTEIAVAEPDVVCFPELATTGYLLNERWALVADTIPGAVTNKLGKMARENGFYLIVGLPERDKDRIFNSAVLIDPQGDVVGVHRKVHLWATERSYFTRGDDFKVYPTKLGLMGIGICYDLDFPESTRIMALKGAQIVFFPSAYMAPYQQLAETYLKSRASENCVFICFSNRIGKESNLSFFGRSQIVSPLCHTLARLKSSRGFTIADLDFFSLTKIREELPYFQHRVPDLYYEIGNYKNLNARSRI
jgi:predicted amidohydrolase